MSRSEEDRKSERLFDKRTLERNLRKGVVTPKDLDTRLTALPDIQDKVAPPPPELHLTPVVAAAPQPTIPTYNIISKGGKDGLGASADDDLDDDDLDDEDDEDLDDEADEDDEDLDDAADDVDDKEAEKLPDAG